MRACRCRHRGTASSHALGALAVGVAALELGAGRRTKADPIDHAVGVLCFAKRGDTVLAGDDLAEIHARDEASATAAAEAVLAAYDDRRRGAARAGHPARRRQLTRSSSSAARCRRA